MTTDRPALGTPGGSRRLAALALGLALSLALTLATRAAPAVAQAETASAAHPLSPAAGATAR